VLVTLGFEGTLRVVLVAAGFTVSVVLASTAV
jgi:hypothetical protein